MDTNFPEKFRLTKSTIISIYNTLPAETKYDHLRDKLESLVTKLAYTAPEIIDHRWCDLYHLIIHYLVTGNSISDASNPVWNSSIQRIWNQSNQQFSQLVKNGKVNI